MCGGICLIGLIESTRIEVYTETCTNTTARTCTTTTDRNGERQPSPFLSVVFDKTHDQFNDRTWHCDIHIHFWMPSSCSSCFLLSFSSNVAYRAHTCLKRGFTYNIFLNFCCNARGNTASPRFKTFDIIKFSISISIFIWRGRWLWRS